MSADKQHLHHRLLEIGHSQRRAVLIMWMWAATLAAGAVHREPLQRAAGVVGLASMLAVTILMTFVLPRCTARARPGWATPGCPRTRRSRAGPTGPDDACWSRWTTPEALRGLPGPSRLEGPGPETL